MENGCDTWTWCKTTHTGLLLNFVALCPLKWKAGLILCILNRAKAICSSKLLFQSDVTKLRQLFLSNGYPIWFFNKFLQRFLTVDNAQIAISSGSHPGQTRHHVFRATGARPGTTQPDLCLAEARSGVLNGPRSGINIWP